MMNLVLIAVILAATVVLMWVRRGRKISAPFAILTFGLVCALGYASLAYAREQERDRAHDACIQRAERSVGNRDQWLWLGEVLQVNLPKRPDIAADLLKHLDANLPQLDAADC